MNRNPGVSMLFGNRSLMAIRRTSSRAYGKALAILTALQQREEFYSIIAQYELSEHSRVIGNLKSTAIVSAW
jgi:hypothetical protein